MIHKLQCTYKKIPDVSLAQEFQKHLSDVSLRHGILGHRKHKNLKYTKLDKQGV